MLTIVCHDAGGSEILSSWLSRQTEPYCLVLAGPALSIFERKIGNFLIDTLESAVAKSDWVLTGTSWQSDLEIEAIKLANLQGKRSVSFLDHWVNYQQRFMRDGKVYFPDEIWVGDDSALKIAKENEGDLARTYNK